MRYAKDTFYVTLRSRLALLNPDRTVVLRGATRPAIMVPANELPIPDSNLLDTFELQWKSVSVDTSEPLPLCSAECDITYKTAGTPEAAGMDRGRVLDTMDAELRAILLPCAALKQNFTTDPVTSLSTEVFWSAPVLSATAMAADTLTRTATVKVFALQEAGGA